MLIDLLKKWASETYEGQRISVCIGVDPYAQPHLISKVHFSEISGADFSKVLSNGMDTLLVLSLSGHIVEHTCIAEPGSSSSWDRLFAPYRHSTLARWAKRTRVVFALNRHGEILVFDAGKLSFVYRRGAWSHFAHAAMMARMGAPSEVRRAVYMTCLDVSFARTGGLVAIVAQDRLDLVKQFVSCDDFLESGSRNKSKVMRHTIAGPFHKLPRSIRQELAGIDGATILAEDGRILAVGAIVSIPRGSDGGGRKAAAKALADLGLAIKVSADGGITAYACSKRNHEPNLVFEICSN
jgi:hypothetical protein